MSLSISRSPLRALPMLALLAALGLLAAPQAALAQPAAAGNDPAAEQFARTVGSDLIALLKRYQHRADLRSALREFLVPKIDIWRMSRFVLGPYARRLDNEQLERWQREFVDYLVRVYATRLKGYSDEKFVVLGSQTRGRNTVVMSEIHFTDERPPLPVQWWLIQQKNGGYRLFDLQVLGVWFAQEQRALFTSVLDESQGSLDALIARLR